MRGLLPQLAKPLFRDRRDAGRRLAAALARFAPERPVVVGLPRGGVPVAYEVARALDAPLDVLVVRKLGAPLQPEYAIGALAEEGAAVVDERAVRALGLSRAELQETAERESRELERRVAAFRGDRAPLDVQGRTVLLVDDGIATGSTAIAAAEALRRRGAARVILAAPVAPSDAGTRLAQAFDDFELLHQPAHFFAVGPWYEHFDQTPDGEVQELLRAGADGDEPAEPAQRAARHNGGLDWSRLDHREVTIHAGAVGLRGDLRGPPSPVGLVVFAHGSGSSRLSPRNIQVASALGSCGFATLLFDLLDERESTDRHNVFDIELLAARLVAATAWVSGERDLGRLPLGLFGASTGAAAALCAAAELGGRVRAVVSRGGRPDLAGERLADVTAPTLLVVGGDDWNVLALNEAAAEQLRCPHELAIVPHATHLFEEPGALERVTELAADWFGQHLSRAVRRDAA
ncbi:MAG TPA: phosphoribosyltransferase family protein [Thermoleophilaceae bacterium]|jgi:putative phosphoribosyl transferase